MKTLKLGTISHGTMRLEDLIPAFVESLRDVDPESIPVLEYDSKSINDSYWDDADGVLEDLFDALNEYCPPYCYFGAHDGDGSDYGVWISWEAVEEASRHEGDVVKVNAGDSWPCAAEILEVSDHGNATLWAWDADEHRHVVAWEVV